MLKIHKIKFVQIRRLFCALKNEKKEKQKMKKKKPKNRKKRYKKTPTHFEQ